jgi:beta-xylosidase
MKQFHLNNRRLAFILAGICILFAVSDAWSQDAQKSTKPLWCPDNGDGTYKNPIIFADYSDPDVIRVGEDYYMTASSFSSFPGLPILHSKDLVNWSIIGHAIKEYPIGDFSSPVHGGGVYAPSMRYHNGEFYIFYGDPDNGIFMTKTQNPSGQWEPLVLVKKTKGVIDTCPFWDDDGNAYLVCAFAKSRAGITNVLHIIRMSADGTKLLDDGKLVIDGNGTAYNTIEGPKLYKRKNYYYIFAPGGGVSKGYQIVFRSKNIFGPYESRIVLEQGKTKVNGPHQGGWIDTKTGEDWFVHFQELLPYGRIIHLQPVRWIDDWPVMGEDGDGDGKGQPVIVYRKPNVGQNNLSICVPQTSDEFEADKLGLQWQWYANYKDEWISLKDRPGFIRLNAVAMEKETPLGDHANLLLQKFPAERFTATTLIDASGLGDGDRAGLVVPGRSTASIYVQKIADGLKVVRTVSEVRKKPRRGQPQFPSPADHEEATASVSGQIIYLRLQVASCGICTFGYGTDGKQFTELGRPFTAVNDEWIGAKVGIFCDAPAGKQSNGYADTDWFRFDPAPE